MIKTVREVVKFENKFWKLNNNEVIFEGKEKGNYVKLKSSALAGVAVLPIDPEGYIYIQEEYRYGIESYMTHIVMGGQTIDETTEEAALKEMQEEIGLSTNNKLISYGFFREMVNIMDQKLFLFVATDVFSDKSRDKENTEFFKNKRKIKLEDAFLMAMKNEFNCAATELLIIKHFLSLKK